MSERSVAEIAIDNPALANTVFNRLEIALNYVLPGSDTHERYRGIGGVGLAVVLAPDIIGRSYNPFDPTTLTRLSFIGNNEELYPEAWRSKETDEEILGGQIPEGMGRFTAFALAKINAIATSKDSVVVSHNPNQISIAPGKIGFAGGQWIRRSLVGASGLWEVHDHLTSSIFADEIVKAANPDQRRRKADDMAADIEVIFERIKSLHAEVPATELTPDQISSLLIKADGVMAKHLASSREE